MRIAALIMLVIVASASCTRKDPNPTGDGAAAVKAASIDCSGEHAYDKDCMAAADAKTDADLEQAYGNRPAPSKEKPKAELGHQ